MARGKFEQRVPVRGRDEFAALGEAFNDMAAQLEERLRELAAERGRLREAIGRFGDALAATHDPYALLPVIVESAVEATGAQGGRLVVDGKEIAREGDPGNGDRSLVIPLGNEGRESGILYLTPRGNDFSDEARELAHWLGSQASVALENARLHRLVERQANTDGLTEPPNRRHFEEALEGEISRAERFGGSLALILADLDDFKQVNDRYGHQAGDDVLQTFADIPRATVREIDCRRGTAARSSPSSFPRPTSKAPSVSPSGCARHWPRARCRRTRCARRGDRELRRRRLPRFPDSGRTSQRPTKPSIVPSALERTVSSRRTRVPSSALPISVVSFARSSTIRRCPVPDPEVVSE